MNPQAPVSPVPIDFSYAGYQAGAVVPQVKAVLAVKPSGGDDTALIQGALDQVASRPVGTNGFRGAVLLANGRFQIKGQLRMDKSGVILRGSGAGTVLVASGISRRTLIVVGADQDPTLDTPIPVIRTFLQVARACILRQSAVFRSATASSCAGPARSIGSLPWA